MPYDRSELHDGAAIDDGAESYSGGHSLREVRQVGGASPASDDIVNLVSPLLLSMSEALEGAPVAVALPESLGSEPSGHGQAPVLCALTPEAAGQGVAETLAHVALDARSRADTPGGGATPGRRLDGTASVNGIQRPAFIWTVPFEGDGVGVLVALGEEAEPLRDRQAALAEGFAKSIGAGLTVVDSHRRRVRASSALVEVARTAGSTLRLEEVLDLVTERTASLVGADRCGLWLLEKDGKTLRPSSLHGMPPDFVRQWKANAIPLESEPLSADAIRTEMPVLVPDAPNDPRTDKDAVHFFSDKTILVLPVIARGQVQGTLFINHVRSHHNYSRAEIETATAIASQAAIAIQNARLYTEVEQWSAQLERLQSIMSKLSRSRSVSSIAEIIADELRNLIKYDNCRVLVLQEDTEELVPLAVVSSSHEYPVETLESLRIAMGQGITGQVAQTGHSVVVGDAAHDPRAYYIPGTAVVDESMIAVPINFEGRVIGVITLSRLGLSQFNESDLQLLEIFVSEAAIEFENARLYQETQKKSRELLASFHRVGDALATGQDVNETLQIVADLAAEMVRARGCAILLVDESDGGLVFRAAKGLPIELNGAEKTPVERRGLAWQVVRDGTPKLVPDLSRVERPEWMNHPAANELRSYLGLPLMSGSRTIGVLAVFGGRVDQFNQADVELLSSFAHQGAIAIRNAQLFSSLQERVRELAGLAEISHSVATLTRLEDTYRELSRSIAQLLHADSCALLLLGKENTLIPQFPAHGFTPRALSGLKFHVDRAVDEDESCCPLRSVDGLVVTCTGQWKNPPWLVAPMRAQDKLIGAVLISGPFVSAFNENDIRLLSILSANAAVIVQNAILFQSVESERDELDAIISNTSDAIIILDQEDRVTRINAAGEALTGWHSSEVVGRYAEGLLTGQLASTDRAPSPASPLLEAIERRHPVPYVEAVVATKEGLERDVAASYSFVRTPDRGEGMSVIIARDISRLREVERMKSEFVSMVSHELRTPLGLIKGYASTLLNPQLTIDEATGHRFLLGIDGAADRLAKLIENIMSVSRIESGLFRLTTQEMNISQVIQNAVTTARATAKGHEITLDLPRRPIRVEGDRVQIELVMDNLLGNAIKYSPMGKPVHVHLQKRNGRVEVKVTDEGIEIAGHHLPKVFEKFYRVEGGYSRRTPGSGLGLYICRSIIEAHGGEIRAESTPGQGSAFTFTLPITQAQRAEQPETLPAGKEQEGA